MNQNRRDDIRRIEADDPSFPRLLADIHDAPKELFVRGELYPEETCVAFVGSRKQSDYGQQITRMLVPPLVRAGVTIVSGLALGIDATAHEAALTAGGRTIAVLGSGIDRAHVTPASHAGLADRIVLHDGAVMSEYAPGTHGTPFTYPRRNRIIAGLSLATVVIEAAEGSGALITARAAEKNKRFVFAVPHNLLSSNAAGVNSLIAAGAHAVTNADTILGILDIDPLPVEETAHPHPDSPIEAAILTVLTAEPVHVDAITKATKLPGSTIASTLTIMELKGLVQNTTGMMYARV